MGDAKNNTHFGGYRNLFIIVRIFSTVYFSLISLASSIISKAYFFFPFSRIRL